MSQPDRDDPRHLLFVYGTLKTGFCRNPYLQGQQFVGPVRTTSTYRLVDCGHFPGLIVDLNHGISIGGELWRVNDHCLQELDWVEDVAGGLYRRGQITLKNCSDPEAMTYFYNRETRSFPDCGDCWTAGQTQ
jgi:gamma-glutamylaminecyclotransferase